MSLTSLVPTHDEIKAISVLAQSAKNSRFFERLGGEAGIFCIMMAAKELGIPLMQAIMGGMRNIDGNIEMSPRLMNAMIRQAGHQIHIIKSDEQICILKGIRKDTGEIYECIYSMEDAKKAGNANKKNYQSYGSDMLFARALSRLGRRLFADVIGTAYVEGEIEIQEQETIKVQGQERAKHLESSVQSIEMQSDIPETTMEASLEEPQQEVYQKTASINDHPSSGRKVTPKQEELILKLLNRLGDEAYFKKILSHYQISDISELAFECATPIINAINEKLAEKGRAA